MAEDSKIPYEIKAGTALLATLGPHKDELSARWIEIVHGTYPFDTIGFLRTRKDRFANPVGYRTEEAAKAVIDALFTETPDQEALSAAVEEIVRVRAIQDFPPETAVGVFFAIKDVIRDVLRRSAAMAETLPALLAMESRVDAVALMAFGAYARCRETLHQLKVDEFKRQHSQILRLADRKAAKQSDKADTQN